MATPITSANMATALAVTGAGDVDSRPLFGEGDVVYDLADVFQTATGGAVTTVVRGDYDINKPYEVISVNLKLIDDAGDTKLADQAWNAADATTPATRSYRAFAHTKAGGLSATVSNTTESNAYFYALRPSGGGAIILNVPQCRLNTKANWDTFIATEVPNLTA